MRRRVTRPGFYPKNTLRVHAALLSANHLHYTTNLHNHMEDYKKPAVTAPYHNDATLHYCCHISEHYFC